MSDNRPEMGPKDGLVGPPLNLLPLSQARRSARISIRVNGELLTDDPSVELINEMEQRIAGKHSGDVRTLVFAAAMAGWTVWVLSEESLTLVPPRANIHGITISARKKPNRRQINQWMTAVMEHGDPLKVEMATMYRMNGIVPDFTLDVQFSNQKRRDQFLDMVPAGPEMSEAEQEKQEVEALGPLAPQEAVEAPVAPPQEPVVVEPPTEASGKREPLLPVKKDEKFKGRYGPSEDVPVPAGHLVSQAPMMSHQQQGHGDIPGKRYPSKSIIERHWSGGGVDFKCALCEFHRPKMEGIRGHWQKHVNDGSADALSDKKVLVEDPEYMGPISPPRSSWTPRSSRVAALAAFLRTLDGKDEEETAQAVLEWIHEQSAKQSPLSAESEPLSDTEVLDRIRRLVDRGEYLEQRKAFEQQAQELDTMRQELARMDRARAKAEREAERARDDMAALHDLTRSWSVSVSDGE